MPGRAGRARGTDSRAARRTAARAGGRVLRRLRGGDGGGAHARRRGRVGSRGRTRRPPRQLRARRRTSRGVRGGGQGSSVGPETANPAPLNVAPSVIRNGPRNQMPKTIARPRRSCSDRFAVHRERAQQDERAWTVRLKPDTTGTPKTLLEICWNRVIAEIEEVESVAAVRWCRRRESNPHGE